LNRSPTTWKPRRGTRQMIKAAALAWMLCMAGPDPCTYDYYGSSFSGLIANVDTTLCLHGFEKIGKPAQPAHECGHLLESDEAADEREDWIRRPWVWDINHPDYCRIRPYLCPTTHNLGPYGRARRTRQ
jgi:hypothetical protein